MSVIAQQHVVEHLHRQWLQGRVPHALLLAGAEGSGKMAIAVEYARLLLCENPEKEGEQVKTCGVCAGCAMTRKLAHPDLHFVFPVIRPKSSSSSSKIVCDSWMKEWRLLLQEGLYFNMTTWGERMGIENQQPIIYSEESEEILKKISLVSSQGGYKVVIVWLPELMHVACANKILKVLEEPPQQTVFILCANQPEKVLPTILSRTQRIDVKAIPEKEIADALQRERGLSPIDAQHIAHLAGGSYTRALQQISISNEESEFFDMFILLMRKCYLRDIKEMHAWSEVMASWGRERQKSFLVYAQRLIRENFIYNFGQPTLNFMSEKEAAFSQNFARFVNERNVIGITEELALAQRDIEHNVNSRMVFFDFSLKMIVLLIS